jgi:hypothetical protein
MMPPLCSMIEDISNSIGNEDVPIVVFSSSSLIPLHKQRDKSPNIPSTRKRSLFLYPLRSRKKVSFGSNHTFGIPSKADMTPDEIQSTWLSRSELKSIKQECIVTVELIEHGWIDDLASDITSDECFCSRGLEAHLPRRRYQKSYNRHQLYRAILEEQWHQYQQVGCICNPEEIARKYERFSFKSAMKAHRLGLEDQLEASTC